MEGQKSINKFQMWKRDQIEGILERRGRNKMRAMRKGRRRPETRNRRMRNNRRTKGRGKILNDTGEGATELKTIMEKRGTIQDGEERR